MIKFEVNGKSFRRRTAKKAFQTFSRESERGGLDIDKIYKYIERNGWRLSDGEWSIPENYGSSL